MGLVADKLQTVNQWWQDLPFQLSDVVVAESYRPVGFRFRNYSFNIAGQVNGKDILVTGEADTKELAITKAVAEFIERCVLIEFAQTQSGIKTSNGWAAHVDIELAKENAIRELIERDAILRHWYTQTPFLEIDFNSLPSKIKNWSYHELSKSEFPILKILISDLGYGPSLTAVLMNKKGYAVTGHCSKESMMDAIEGAIEEACRMAHHYLVKTYLMDTEKLKKGEFARVETGSHGVYYAHQEPLPDWMFEKIIEFKSALKNWNAQNAMLDKCKYKFQIRQVASEPLYVVQAVSDSCIELGWGHEKMDSLLKRLNGKIEQQILLKSKLNLKPHIIS